jgi:predicted RNA-binding Zn-ribbon protein involved in translation (DUF1610 family)
MHACKHHHLLLVHQRPHKLRCQHCHLTIDAGELTHRYCPECFERRGKKRYDFEEVKETNTAIIQYRCEDCGVMIDDQ